MSITSQPPAFGRYGLYSAVALPLAGRLLQWVGARYGVLTVRASQLLFDGSVVTGAFSGGTLVALGTLVKEVHSARVHDPGQMGSLNAWTRRVECITPDATTIYLLGCTCGRKDAKHTCKWVGQEDVWTNTNFIP